MIFTMRNNNGSTLTLHLFKLLKNLIVFLALFCFNLCIDGEWCIFSISTLYNLVSYSNSGILKEGPIMAQDSGCVKRGRNHIIKSNWNVMNWRSLCFQRLVVSLNEVIEHMNFIFIAALRVTSWTFYSFIWEKSHTHTETF